MDNQNNLLDLAPTNGYTNTQLGELVKKLLYRAEVHEFIQDDDAEYTLYFLERNQKKQRVR
jgi:hypothetical protein